MIDHFLQFDIRNAAANLNGIPMFLVHVIPGSDLLVPVSQVDC
jgi:hypothetical protein